MSYMRLYVLQPSQSFTRAFTRPAILSIALFIIFFSSFLEVKAQEAVVPAPDPVATPVQVAVPTTVTPSSAATSPTPDETAIKAVPQTPLASVDAPTQTPAPTTPKKTAAFAKTAASALAAGSGPSNNNDNINSLGQADTITRINTRVNHDTGALEYSYPITIPSGRGMVTPNLSLQYNNQTASDMDVFGYGWKISLPYVELINKIGVDTIYEPSATKFYSSSLSGELTNYNGSTTYTARTVRKDYLVYTYLNNSWQAVDTNGTKYFFGTATTSRQDDPKDSSHIARWLLDRVEDSNGNFATYTYSKDSGQIYPNTILYTNSQSASGTNEINFIKSPVTTPIIYFNKGFSVSNRFTITTIEAKINTTKVHQFLLRYSPGMNEGRGLLLGIAETGFQHGVAATVPESTFSYSGTQLPTWTPNQFNETFPEPLSDHDLGVRFGDLNGDGLTDIVRYYRRFDMSYQPPIDYTIRRVSINKGNGNWDIDVAWDWDDISVPFVLSESNYWCSSTCWDDFGTRLIDINGDGRDDLIVAYGAPNDHNVLFYPTAYPLGQNGVYINTGHGFKRDLTWTGLDNFTSWSSGGKRLSFNGHDLIDVNGDGLPDIVASTFNSTSNGSVASNTVSGVLINTGHNWIYDPTWKLPTPLATLGSTLGYTTFDDVGTRFADVNGDGLIDIIRACLLDGSINSFNKNTDEQTVYLNNGHGWVKSNIWVLPDIYFIFNHKNTGYSLSDINGDKLPDIIESFKSFNNIPDHYSLYLNTGHGWTYKDYKLPFYLSSTYQVLSTGVTLSDFNGDTIPDALALNYMSDPFSTTTPPQQNGGSVIINNAEIPDQLTQITDSTGATTKTVLDGYLHTTQGNYSTIGTTTQNPIVVTNITNSSQVGGSESTAYAYKNADIYYSSTSISDRQPTGFGEITETRSDGSKIVTKYHQNNGTSGDEIADSYGRISLPYQEDILNAAGGLMKRSYTHYTETPIASSTAVSVLINANIIRHFDGGASSTVDTADTFTYDEFGNETNHTAWGTVILPTAGIVPFGDTGSDKISVDTTYWRNPLIYQVSRPEKTTTTSYYGAKIGEDTYAYDTHGNELGHGQWIGGTTYATTSHTYTTEGLVATEVNPLGATTTYTYDIARLYPSAITNAKGQATSYTYDYLAGKPTSVTAPSGEVTTHSFDVFGRLVSDGKTLDTGATTTTRTLSYNTTNFPHSVTETLFRTANDTSTHITYTDGFGRTILDKISAPTGYNTTRTTYDTLGNTQSTSLPYSESTSAYTTTAAPVGLTTSYTYDALGRVLTATTPRGTSKNAYSGFVTTATDVLGHSKKFVTDAHGNIASVSEILGGKTYVTRYGYNATNHLVKIIDATGNVRNFWYDGRGLRTKAEDLHTATDTVFGIYTYGYDKLGNQTKVIDPLGLITTYSYDTLGRPVTEDSTSTVGIDVRYYYDSCSAGKLCTVITPSATTTYTYDKAGNKASESITIAGGSTYKKSFTYNFQNQPLTTTYPNGTAVSYTYDQAGLSLATKIGTTTIATALYNPAGLVTKVTYSNGITTTNTYNTSRLYELQKVDTVRSGFTTPVRTVAYTYDNDGQIITLTDSSPSTAAKKQTFTYDALHRLTKVVATSTRLQTPYTETYTYDVLGNILNKNGATTTYGDTGYTNPHAPLTVGSTTYTYNNRGDLASDGNTTYTWDYDHHLTSSKQGSSATTTYTYNFDNRRLKLTEAGKTTVYPWSDYEVTGTTTSIDINLGSLPIARKTTATTTYLHTDHLGSTTLTSDSSGNTVDILDYFPYGAERLASTKPATDRHYIGQIYDSGTKLNYLNARYYDSTRGQFTSQDPVFWEIGQSDDGKKVLADPQQMNSYSYARNNPIMGKDASGRSWETFGEGVISPVVYAYNHPFQTVGITAVTAGVIITAPVTATAVGAVGIAAGVYSVGNAAYNAYNAPDADTRDYYLGQGLSAGALTATGIKGRSINLNKSSASRNGSWRYGTFKSETKWTNQFEARGWTPDLVTDAIQNGKSFNAPNLVNPGNNATRYVSPKTGQYVVVDNKTRELLQVGGKDFIPK